MKFKNVINVSVDECFRAICLKFIVLYENAGGDIVKEYKVETLLPKMPCKKAEYELELFLPKKFKESEIKSIDDIKSIVCYCLNYWIEEFKLTVPELFI